MRTAIGVGIGVVFVASVAHADECAVTHYENLSYEETESIGAAVCTAPNIHDVHAEKVGARYVVTWTTSDGPRQVSAMSIAELPDLVTRAAAPSPPRPPLEEKPRRAVHAIVSLLMPTATKLETNLGIGFGVLAGSEEWQFLGEVRFAGDPFQLLPAVDQSPAGESLFYAALSAGVRRAFPTGTRGPAPFVGAGLALESIGQFHASPTSLDGQAYDLGGGIAGTAEIGVALDLNRRKDVGAELDVRVDVPAFTVDHGAAPIHTEVVAGSFGLRF